MSSTPLLTADQLAARSQRALATATAAGRELGLTVDDPTIVHDAFSVVVHLAPSPVAVRVPVVLPDGFELSMQTPRQTRELTAVAWLADRGQPVVRPSPLVPRVPVVRDGFSMTFWEWVEVDATREPDYDARGPVVAGLHAALRDYPAPLQFLLPLSMSVSNGLGYLEHHPELLGASDVDRAKREWQLLAPVVMSRGSFSAAFPGVTTQALHGDSPGFNLIETKTGLLHSDFEDVTLGPVEWDLTMQPPSAVDTYDQAAMRAGLRRVDHELLSIMNVLRMLQVVACHSLIPKLPALADLLTTSLEAWRQMPFAGGYKAKA
ncbi:MAG TPA: hypothetical protein VFG30_26045 [Polyangiales bacterium]|jgi:hypothetical protein|nr:hypothetical protein [Polyangiales bacterium]